MRPASSIASALELVDACRLLGPKWGLARIKLVLDKRLGLTRKRSAIRSWTNAAADPGALQLIDCESLSDYLTSHLSETQEEELRARVAGLSAKIFPVFGQRLQFKNWHADPMHIVEYERTHWSEVPDFDAVDIKVIWEPSRFTWALDIARLHRLEPAEGHAEVFWTLLEDWLDENPPNEGVNWGCGQESSVRLLRVVLAAQAMPESLTPRRNALVHSLAVQTAERVLAHIHYAKSQRNNHLTSEIMGLLLAASLYPANDRVDVWLEAGAEHLESAFDELVFEDGGTSQYSMNYHRVFLDAFLVIELLSVKRGAPFVERQTDVIRRVALCLEGMVDDSSGSAPFFGHDDGAHLLSLANLDHRDLRSCLQLSRWLLDTYQPLAAGPWNEVLAWFGLSGEKSTAEIKTKKSISQFPDFGIYVVRVGPVTVWVRCGPFRFRPAHADQLNVDVWYDGQPVTVDRGTFAYTTTADESGRFISAEDHSTLTVVGRDHMPTIGRFLWSRWNSGRVVECVQSADSVRIVVETQPHDSPILRRTIQVDRSRVVTTDETLGAETAWQTQWQLAGSPPPLALQPREDDVLTLGAGRALNYRALCADVTTVVRRPDSSGRIVSEFSLDPERR